MSEWTHPQCERCWITQHALKDPDGTVIGVDSLPHRIKSESGFISDPAICCWCFEITISGIYGRHDPADLPCHGDHGSGETDG